MGEPKQLLSWQGQSLVERAVAAAGASACARVFAVLGANALEVGRVLEPHDAFLVSNPSWASGLASSIRAGVAAALQAETGGTPRWEGLLITLADQPDVSSLVLDALVLRFRGASEDAIVACSYAGTLGVPALFGRAHFDGLSALSGDAGAKRLLEAHAGAVDRVPFEAGAIDVDTPEDYRALLARQGPGRGA